MLYDDNIKEGFVLVEADEYDYALGYKEDELIFIKWFYNIFLVNPLMY